MLISLLNNIMKTAYIVLFLLIIGVLGSVYAYRMTQTLNYVHGKGAIKPVTADDYAHQHLYGNRQPQTITPADSAATDTLQEGK